MKKRLSSLVCAALLLAAMALPAGRTQVPSPRWRWPSWGWRGGTAGPPCCLRSLPTVPTSPCGREDEEGEWVRRAEASPRYELDDPEYPAWSAFCAWEEEQRDWFFLQEVWDASEGSFRWGYYPPSVFQIGSVVPGGGRPGPQRNL